jgi:excisionase family DNA binding protein
MQVLSVQEAAELLEVDARTVYRLIERDGLPAFKVGRQWRMRLRDVESWIDAKLEAREPAGTYRLAQQPLLSEAGLVPPTEDDSRPGFSDSAFSENADLPVHSWVPWIAGFSATFVAEVFDHYLANAQSVVLDPFAGVGTTLVTALLRGHATHGFEINPYAAEVARLKLDVHSVPADELERDIERFRTSVGLAVREGPEPESRPPDGFKTRRRFLSPEVERKVLLVRDFTRAVEDPLVRSCFRVALGAELVGFSNYSYEPSLGTRAAAGKRDVTEAPVVATIVRKLRRMLSDIRLVQQDGDRARRTPPVHFVQGDFFASADSVPSGGVELVVTSPPYLNNYHYIRNSRPQVYWLEMVNAPQDLKPVELGSFGKYWQTVRTEEQIPLVFEMPELQDRLEFLRRVNAHKGPYGGPGWANYAATYFNDSYRLAAEFQRMLKPRGKAVVVLGNSILQGVEFRTDEIFARICELRGIRTGDILPLRQKRTGTSIINSSVRANAARAKTQLYESAVVLSKGRG